MTIFCFMSVITIILGGLSCYIDSFIEIKFDATGVHIYSSLTVCKL